jgi:hypothetical protein
MAKVKNKKERPKEASDLFFLFPPEDQTTDVFRAQRVKDHAETVADKKSR